jgi:aldehyde dehydrogenase (NAD+)
MAVDINPFDGTVPLFIGGESVMGVDEETFVTEDPGVGDSLIDVAAAGQADVDRAVAAAREGADAWQRVEPPERGRRLLAVAESIRDHKAELARLESLDQGKPLWAARGSIETAARYMEFYAGLADKIHGDTIPLDGSWNSKTIPEPYGVSAQVTPWNYPITQLTRGAAPALAAGNAVVTKPAEQTPLTTIRVAQLAYEAGLPAGALNAISGFGPEAGEPLVSHDDVDVVTFTGSRVTGQRVMESAATQMTPVTLELGGKSPAIVFEDADVDQVVESLLLGILRNAGQTCSASSRLLVTESLHDEVVNRFVSKANDYELGHGLENPDMGPLVSEEQFEKVLNYIEVGKREGATLRTGGGSTQPGYFVEPTVFTGVTHDMRIAQEEIFGPVIAVSTFTDEDEAIELANDVEYGLVAGVFTSDYERANRVARAIDAGQIFINDWFAGGVETPFGGYKQSGVGREKGAQAVKEYTQLKTINSRSFHRE